MPQAPDSIDLMHLRQMYESRGWEIVERRIGEMLVQQRQSLEGDLDAANTARVRGGIEITKRILGLRSVLQKELGSASAV